MPSWNVEEWRRPGPTAQQRRNDLLTGLGATGLAVISLFLLRSTGYFESDRAPAIPEEVFWAVATTVPLVWRRRFPDAVAVVISVFFIAGQIRFSQEQMIVNYALFAAIYTLGAWGRNRQRARMIRLGIVAVMFAWLTLSFVLYHDAVSATMTDKGSGELSKLWSAIFISYLQNIVYFGFTYLMGNAAWRSVWRQHQLAEQAEELRAAQAAAAGRAVLDERVRIARELHDVVAHHVSVMGIQASACRRALDRDPARAVTALTAVEDGARTAVDELRRMLGALRATGPATRESPGAGLDRVEEIVERAREAGLQVDFGIFGTPVPLPDSLSQAAYRIVQESVTNTLKHAGASGLDIRIRYLAGELELDVADDGHGGGGRAGSGMGLIGMRERVAVHDGTLECGRRTGGGYRVRARLPYAPAAVESAA
ncbi:histidine kinase [Actinoplanes sp. SE50]|uniref:sensor histidine kinase n=1 Tax=unclassified Actinoplanes TaxID=2626549 RepID=UPI00023EBFE0|nr:MULTISPECIES: histidine kinase [unclassified Actinoplanes]AEV88117.1 Sensor histidine kinase yvfT [Actinoplanes sp. SE50/110]ATO86522.1 histidine kinase [Actinoplanes sp. SE50]SLM03939.1 Two-component histidine kinase dimerization and phosphoacceptor region [Actinoplanes sp. SE50/110]